MATRCFTPSSSSSAFSAATISRTVIAGKSGPYGWPVRGLMLAPLVEPKDEPSMFDETTKSLSVSIALPGPINPSHQPGRLPFAGLRPAA